MRRLWMLGSLPIVAALCAPSVALADNNVGAGVMAGTMTWSAGESQPQVGTGNDFVCATTAFAFTATASIGAIADVPASEYAGPVAISASGGSTCALPYTESGSWTMSMVGTGPRGQFSCSNLTNNYVRVGLEEIVDVVGTCSVGLKPQGFVEFVAVGQQVPLANNASGQAQAAFVAPFALLPV